MKIIEAIGKVDELKPNQYTNTNKVDWLSHLDLLNKTQVFDTHEGTYIEFNGYPADVDVYNTDLLVEAPYDQIYIHWLMAQIDLANGEMARYNAQITLFNTYWDEYKAFFNRSHRPISTAKLRY